MRYKLAIFDFDGTLADSADWFFGNLNAVAARCGFRQVSQTEIAQLRGCSNREIIRQLQVPTWRLPSIARHMRAAVARDAETIRLFAGVDQLLERLERTGLLLAIVSSNSEANVRRILGVDNARRIAIYECGSSLFGKAANFRRAVKCAGVMRGEAVAIGDEARDVEAAEEAGLASAVVLWGYATEQAFAGLSPTYRFSSIDELGDALTR